METSFPRYKHFRDVTMFSKFQTGTHDLTVEFIIFNQLSELLESNKPGLPKGN